MARRIRDEATDSWDDKVAVDRFVGKGGHFIRGRARVTGASSVEVNGQEITAGTALVLATGARAWVPPMFEEIPHWTNREAIATETVPESLLVVGGGPVGLEIGQVMSRFGAAVTIVESDDRLAGAEEPEVSEMITGILRREGITVRTGVRIVRVESDAAGGCTVHFGRRVLGVGGTRVGRHRSSFGSGGPRCGGPRARRHVRTIPTDVRMRVMPGVWGVGDVTGKGAFTHVAMYQARICVADILGHQIAEADYRAVPRVTFTDPEIGSVGLTEAAARESGGEVRVMHESDRGLRPGVDQQGRGTGQAGRTGRRARRGHLHGAVGRRGPRPVDAGRSRPDSRGHVEEHDLRLPDVSPGDRFGPVVPGAG